MKNEIQSLFDAATEIETIGGVELEKIKTVLEQIVNLCDEYGKYRPEFFQYSDGNYIRIMTNIAFDYVCDLMENMEDISQFLYGTCWSKENNKHLENNILKEVA